jgi:hypothetical protein
MDKITESKIYAAIQTAHAPPEWAIFRDVANGTGGNIRRRADSIAMNLYPSRGLLVRGFEIKISRQDFKREHKDPQKAEEIAQYCDEWYVVTPQGLVKDLALELPSVWGLMEVDEKGKIRTAHKATMLTPKPLSRSFIASIVRSTHKLTTLLTIDWVRREEIQSKIEEAERRGLANAPIRLENVQNELRRYQRALQTFKENTGVDILEGGYADHSAEIAEQIKIGRAILGKYRMGLTDVPKLLDRASREISEVKHALEQILVEQENLRQMDLLGGGK